MDIAGAQHYIECGSCDKYSKFYCNSCHSRLCEQCKKEHLRDKENRDHEVVLYSDRKIELSVEICKKHPKKSKDLCCRDCKVAICSKCLIESHKGHDFEDIELVYAQKKSLCMKSISDIRNTILPKGYSLLEELQKHKTACMDCSSNMRSRLKDNVKFLHNIVDTVSSELEESINKIEKSITDELNDQENLLNDHISQLTETTNEYERDILSKKPTALISSDTPIEPSMKDMPDFVKPCLPIYAEGQIDKDGIVKQLGNIIQSMDQQNETFNLKGPTKHTTAEDIKNTKNIWEPEWEYKEITLERGNFGYGFSMAGGRDNRVNLYISNINPGGSAAKQQRLRENDIIVKINDVYVSDTTHFEAVQAVKQDKRKVVLLVKRVPPKNILDIEFVIGNMGLGFKIKGGIGNQCIDGDHGIFISEIIKGGASEQDGRLAVGDRLLLVNDVDLQNVTHEEAVAALKASHGSVHIKVAKPHCPKSD